MSTGRIGTLVFLGFLMPSSGATQSLEDAAAREAARRRQAAGSRAYTNKDLPKPTPPRQGEEPAAAPAPPPEAGPSTESARSESAPPVPEPKGPPARTEAEWRQAADAARKAVELAKDRLKAAQDKRAKADEALGPSASWAAKGHPAALLSVVEEGEQASKAADEAQAALTAAEAALESLVAEATALGVPDSWWADPKSS